MSVYTVHDLERFRLINTMRSLMSSMDRQEFEEHRAIVVRACTNLERHREEERLVRRAMNLSLGMAGKWKKLMMGPSKLRYVTSADELCDTQLPRLTAEQRVAAAAAAAAATEAAATPDSQG